MLYTLMYLEVIKKPLPMASQVAQMNGKKEQGQGREDSPYYNLKTAITKKNRQMQREKKPLNINK